MSRRPQFAELETTLGQLVPALARLSELLVLQRQAVAAGDLDRLLALTTDQELASARLATLEARRDGLQSGLEGALGVQGLDALAQADRAAYAASGLPELVDALRFEVVRLHQENRRAAELLAAATELASRTRTFLERLTGHDAGYPALANGAVRMDG
jgi:hypothetical protein